MHVHLFERTHHQQTEHLSRISGTIKNLQVSGNNVLNYAFCLCLSAVLWVNRQSSLFITTNMSATQLRGLLAVCSSLHSHLIFHIANVVALVDLISLIISMYAAEVSKISEIRILPFSCISSRNFQKSNLLIYKKTTRKIRTTLNLFW